MEIPAALRGKIEKTGSTLINMCIIFDLYGNLPSTSYNYDIRKRMFQKKQGTSSILRFRSKCSHFFPQELQSSSFPSNT